MAPNKQNDREARQARERLRAYQARQTVHEAKARRRVRDNWLAGIGVLVVVVLAVLTQLLYFTSGPGKPVASPKPSASAAAYTLPPKTLAGNRQWTGTMTINAIPLGISLDGAKAPQAVSSTIALSQKGFYDGLSCHRLTTSGIYVLQCGDPKGDGTGGPGYTYGPVENAPADNVYKAGTIAMARASGNAYSNGHQFFICFQDTTLPTDAAGGYTVVGTVTSGLDQLQSQIVAGGITPGANGATDGSPTIPTSITSFTLQ